MNATAHTPQRLVGQMEMLAEPIRIRLLRLLERHELGVTDLCDVLQLPQSTVSRHLKVLAERGWVGSRRHGTANLYRFEPALEGAARQIWRAVRDEAGRWATARQDQLRLTRRLDERRRRSRSFFARAAGSWDATRRQFYGDEFLLPAVLGLLPRDWRVADLGCGTGALTVELARHVREVVGVDESDAMLAAARRRAAGLDNVRLLDGALEQLPLEDGACDAALLVLALSYVADAAAALAEMRRILRPGGRAAIVDLLPHDREDFRRELGQTRLGFDPDAIERMMTAAGLSQPAVRPLPPAPGAKGPALFLATAGA